MPIENGAYKAPTWVNNKAPAISADELNAMSGTIESSQILTGAAAPTTSTAGAVGQLYLAMISTGPEGSQYPLYQCTAAVNGTYTWKLVSASIDTAITVSDASQLAFFVETDQTRNLSELLVQIGAIIGQKTGRLSMKDTSCAFTEDGYPVTVTGNQWTQSVALNLLDEVPISQGAYFVATCGLVFDYVGLLNTGTFVWIDGGYAASAALKLNYKVTTWRSAISSSNVRLVPLSDISFAAVVSTNSTIDISVFTVSGDGAIRRTGVLSHSTGVSGFTLDGAYPLGVSSLTVSSIHVIWHYSTSGNASYVQDSIFSITESNPVFQQTLTVNADTAYYTVNEVSGIQVASPLEFSDRLLPVVYRMRKNPSVSANDRVFARGIYADSSGAWTLTEESVLASADSGGNLWTAADIKSPGWGSSRGYCGMLFYQDHTGGTVQAKAGYLTFEQTSAGFQAPELTAWRTFDGVDTGYFPSLFDLPRGHLDLPALGVSGNSLHVQGQTKELLFACAENKVWTSVVPFEPEPSLLPISNGLYFDNTRLPAANGSLTRVVQRVGNATDNTFILFGGSPTAAALYLYQYGPGEVGNAISIDGKKPTGGSSIDPYFWYNIAAAYAGAMLAPGTKAGTQILTPEISAYSFMDDYLWVQRNQPVKELLGSFSSGTSTSVSFDLSTVDLSAYSRLEIYGTLNGQTYITVNGLSTNIYTSVCMRGDGTVATNYHTAYLNPLGNASYMRRLMLRIYPEQGPFFEGQSTALSTSMGAINTCSWGYGSTGGNALNLESIMVSGFTATAGNELKLYGVR